MRLQSLGRLTAAVVLALTLASCGDQATEPVPSSTPSSDMGGAPTGAPPPEHTAAPLTVPPSDNPDGEDATYEPLEKPESAIAVGGGEVGTIELPVDGTELHTTMSALYGLEGNLLHSAGCQLAGDGARRVEVQFGPLVFAGESYDGSAPLISGWHISDKLPPEFFPPGGVQVGDSAASLAARVEGVIRDDTPLGALYGPEVYWVPRYEDDEEPGPEADVRWRVTNGRVDAIFYGWPVCQQPGS